MRTLNIVLNFKNVLMSYF